MQDSNLRPLASEPVPDDSHRFSVDRTVSQVADFSQGGRATASHRLSESAPIRTPFATHLLPKKKAQLRVIVEPLLSVREVAARLGVSTATVYKLCARGELAHVRVCNSVRVRREDFEAFARAGR